MTLVWSLGHRLRSDPVRVVRPTSRRASGSIVTTVSGTRPVQSQPRGTTPWRVITPSHPVRALRPGLPRRR
jgi:hypothetical protein